MSNTSATDARTPPVAVWQILEKLRGQDLIDWRVAPLDDRPSPAERGLDIGFPFGWYAIEPVDFVRSARSSRCAISPRTWRSGAARTARSA